MSGISVALMPDASTSRPAREIAADIDRKVSLLQHALTGMQDAPAPPCDADLAGLAELAQDVRDHVVELRIEVE
jgi:hypothetical protein